MTEAKAPSAFQAWWRDTDEERVDIRWLAARTGWNAALEAAAVAAGHFVEDSSQLKLIEREILALREKV